MPRDLLARQPVTAREKIGTVARKEVIRLAQHDLCTDDRSRRKEHGAAEPDGDARNGSNAPPSQLHHVL